MGLHSIRLSVFVSLLAAIVFVGCSRPTPPIAKTEPVTVSVANPVQKKVSKTSEYLATLEAVEVVQLKSRVTGYLKEIKFEPGKEVKKDQVLFIIDKRPYEVDLKKAQADLKSAVAEIDYAKKDVVRLEKGLRNNSISREDYDKGVANVGVTEAKVDLANSSIDRAKLNLEYCEVKSPINGIVSRESVTIGNLVQADQTILTTIVTKDPVYAYFEVDQRTVQEYLRLTAGKRNDPTTGGVYPVTMGLDDDTGFPHQGVLDFADNRVNPNTGSLLLRGVFSRKDVKRDLLPGFSARVRLDGPEPIQAILVPDRVINTDQDRKFVWVVNQENKVEYRRVTLGFLVDNLRVITDGITTNDRIVINGIQNIRQGSVIQPQFVDMLTELPLSEAKKN